MEQLHSSAQSPEALPWWPPFCLLSWTWLFVIRIQTILFFSKAASDSTRDHSLRGNIRLGTISGAEKVAGLVGSL
jgi:hypothetical protein